MRNTLMTMPTARGRLLANVATMALGLALVAGAPVQAQQAPQGQQGVTPSQPQAAQGPLQRAAQELRVAHQQLGDASGNASPQAVQRVRQALDQMTQALGQMPQDQRGQVEQRVNQAREALQGETVPAPRARSAIEQVLSAVPAGQQPGATGGQQGATGGSSQVVVQQAAPSLQLTQPAPEVTVEQPDPVITVVVPQPEIIVRQPPPQVTVQMPEPRVTVRQAPPQVRVSEADPQVQVQQAQPRVQVQRGQPQVRVQQAEGQPQVRFEQQGQPVVRLQQGDQQAAAQQQQRADTSQTGTSASPQPAQSGGGPAQPAAARGAAAGLTLDRASGIVGTNVLGANGRDAGEVENLLIDGNGQVRAAVVEWGGFLGIGTRRAVVPIEQLAFGGPNDRVRMDLSRAQLEALPRYEPDRIQEYGRNSGWADGVRAYR
jgi:hypothetical protein